MRCNVVQYITSNAQTVKETGAPLPPKKGAETTIYETDYMRAA